MNRNVLKILGIVSMLIDHVGVVFFPQHIVFRVLGRMAFPIFAFFIAEGFFFTRNKWRYFFLLFVFAVVSQVPYAFFGANAFELNILFTFAFAVLLLCLFSLVKSAKDKTTKFAFLFSFILVALLVVWLDTFSLLDYGSIGVLVVLVFFFCREKSVLKFSLFCILMIVLATKQSLHAGVWNLTSLVQIFAILCVPFLIFFNGEKGKRNLKFLFYVFYPVHIAILVFVREVVTWCS